MHHPLVSPRLYKHLNILTSKSSIFIHFITKQFIRFAALRHFPFATEMTARHVINVKRNIHLVVAVFKLLFLLFSSVCAVFHCTMASTHTKDCTFLGSRIPPEVDSLSKNLKDVDQESFRKILKGKYK